MILDNLKLKTFLEESSMTRKEFAKALRVSESCIYRWLKGEREPTMDNYLHMVKVLKLRKLEDLLMEEGT